MSYNRNVHTIQEFGDEVKTIQLRLTGKAETVAAGKKLKVHDHSKMEAIKYYWENMFGKARDDLETEATSEATQRNKAKIDRMFDSMIDKLNAQRNEVKNELDGLTPQQQADLITFWLSVETFFADLMQGIQKVFTLVMEKIRQGLTIVKDAVKGFFNALIECIKIIF